MAYAGYGELELSKYRYEGQVEKVRANGPNGQYFANQYLFEPKYYEAWSATATRLCVPATEVEGRWCPQESADRDFQNFEPLSVDILSNA